MSWTLFDPQVEVRESNALSNIDGFLVTDGNRVRVTLRANLSPLDKARGKSALLKRMRSSGEPGVYIWSRGDGQAQYNGANTGGW
jgi:hypothetical protein